MNGVFTLLGAFELNNNEYLIEKTQITQERFKMEQSRDRTPSLIQFYSNFSHIPQASDFLVIS